MILGLTWIDMCQIKMCQLQYLQGASFHRQLSQQGLPNIADVNIYEMMVIMNERKEKCL